MVTGMCKDFICIISLPKWVKRVAVNDDEGDADGDGDGDADGDDDGDGDGDGDGDANI